MNWEILGIEETKSRDAIKKAYRERLAKVNPEEKPEEFKALREAYETALELCKIAESSDDGNLSELDRWAQELDRIYDSFSRRIDIKEWKKHYSNNLCEGLDTKADTEKKTLEFLMRKFRIPKECLEFISEKYSWLEKQEELYANYPTDFIDNVILKRLKEDVFLPVELFGGTDDGEKVDAYIKLYYESKNLPDSEALDSVSKLKEKNISHPIVDSFIARVESANGVDGAIDKLAALSHDYMNVPEVQENYAYALINLERFEECKIVCENSLEQNPSYQNIKFPLITALGNLCLYKDALDRVDELADYHCINSRFISVLNEIHRKWNELYIEILEKEYEAEPENAQKAYDLSYAYYRQERREDSKRIAQTLKEETPSAYAYYNIMGALADCEERYEDAVFYEQKLLKACRELKPDGTVHTQKRIDRYPEIVVCIASLYYKMGKKEEALEQGRKALELDPDNLVILNFLVAICIHAHDYNGAYEYSKKMAELAPNSISGYMDMAQCLYLMGKYGDAYNALMRVFAVDRYEAESYFLKIRIFLKTGAFKEAKEELDYILENGIREEQFPEVYYVRALLAKQEGDNKELRSNLWEAYKAVRDNLAGHYWIRECAYEYALCLVNNELASKAKIPEEDYRFLLEKILDPVIEIDPDFYPAIDLRAWINNKLGDNKKALADYRILIKVSRNPDYYKDMIMLSLFNIGAPYYEEALELYLEKLEKEDNPDLYYCVGMCYYYTHDFDNAEIFFKKIVANRPNSTLGYYHLADLYLAKGMTQLALDNINKTLELVKEAFSAQQIPFFLKKVMILKRMGKYKAAIKVLKFIKKEHAYPNNSTSSELCDIYLSMGKMRKAGKAAYDMGMDLKERPRYFRVLLAEGKLDKAERFLEKNKKKFGEKEYYKCLCKVFREKADYSRVLDISASKLVPLWGGEDKMEADDLNTYIMDCSLAGEHEKAGKLARVMLERIENINLKEESNYVIWALYKGVAYSVLGKKKEALECFNTYEDGRVCLNCTYCSCLDKECFLAFFAILFSVREEALKKIEEGRNKWPSDNTFRELQIWLEKTRYEGCWLV